MKMIHLHTNTPRVTPLGCLEENDHITHVRYLSQKQAKIKDHRPSMTLSKLPFKMILAPKEKC